jgi:hypothetical protein
MKRFTVVLTVLALLGLAGGLMAAAHNVRVEVKQFNVMRINPAADVVLVIDEPAVFGEAPADAEDATTYLQYSVIKAASATYKVTGKITTNTVPTGALLYVNAVVGSGGLGEQGASAGEIALPEGAAAALSVITGMESCFTGSGGTDGANLEYRLAVDSWATIQEAAETTLVVTYTIAAE